MVITLVSAQQLRREGSFLTKSWIFNAWNNLNQNEIHLKYGNTILELLKNDFFIAQMKREGSFRMRREGSQSKINATVTCRSDWSC